VAGSTVDSWTLVGLFVLSDVSFYVWLMGDSTPARVTSGGGCRADRDPEAILRPGQPPRGGEMPPCSKLAPSSTLSSLLTNTSVVISTMQ
jgi:hypothetical protein